MKKETQLNWVRKHIDDTNSISRNFCLQNYVSRLSALIFMLNEEGYVFDAKFVKFKTNHGWEGRDFVYTCTYNPNKVSVSQKGLFDE